MTLLIGIVCDDGAVIAADRQVSLGVMGQVTVAQPGTKIDVIAGQVLYGICGQVSLGQQMQAVVAADQPKFGGRSTAKAIQDLQTGFRAVLDPAFATAQRAKQVLGPQASFMDVLCGGLLAAKFSDGIQLIDVNHQGLCEILTPSRVPFACNGSGKLNADPILRFLWNTYWDKQRPTLREAVLAAHWTIKIAIDLKTTGVGFRSDVFVLEKTGKDLKHVKARQVSDDELAEHDEFIQAVGESMRGVRDEMMGRATTTEAVEPPPIPPADKAP